jgi:NADP-dependent 3-hydroxy acid dehydrogenase YdfG
MSRLKDRIAVVSGAATGIGKAAAVRLAAEGAIVELRFSICYWSSACYCNEK